jgi:type I restriction enzyme R subunit
LTEKSLRNCQIEAIRSLKGLFQRLGHEPLQMATGSRKTYTGASFIYRLIKFVNAKRLLIFLVDKSKLPLEIKEEEEEEIIEELIKNAGSDVAE